MCPSLEVLQLVPILSKICLSDLSTTLWNSAESSSLCSSYDNSISTAKNYIEFFESAPYWQLLELNVGWTPPSQPPISLSCVSVPFPMIIRKRRNEEERMEGKTETREIGKEDRGSHGNLPGVGDVLL